MKIDIGPVIGRLEAYVNVAKGKEVSGMGFVTVDEATKAFVVYDVVPMHIGSSAATQIPPEKIQRLMGRDDANAMKLWWHSHPVGNGIPGSHNWSGVDHNSATKTPLGSPIPEAIGWSIAIVRTPHGWVGRFDNHINRKTNHVCVIPDIRNAIIQAEGLICEANVRDKRDGTLCPRCGSRGLRRSDLVTYCVDCDYEKYSIGYDPCLERWDRQPVWLRDE